MVRKTPSDERRRRKLFTFGWIALLFVLISSLIYWEQTALLYIFATVGVTVLLIVVAVADLGEREATGTASEASEPAAVDGKGAGSFSGAQSPSK